MGKEDFINSSSRQVELNIIGDIAGNFKTLQALLKKMPSSALPLSAGDQIDRGPSSKDVCDFFKEKGLAVLGNHEHFMITEYNHFVYGKPRYYQDGVWLCNGGDKTLLSFLNKSESKSIEKMCDIYASRETFWSSYTEDDMRAASLMYEKYIKQLPQDTIEWLESLPLYLEYPGLFVSHGVVRPDWKFDKCLYLGDKVTRSTEDSIIWNVGSPRRMEDRVQVFGHVSFKDVAYLKDKQGVFAIGIDTSRSKILTGLHYPSMTIYQQEIID